MIRRKCGRGILSVALAMLCFLALSLQAHAETPDVQVKGALSAESTLLDRSAFADGSQYENPLTEVHTVRIGLRYGKRAVYEAAFENTAGIGFAFGVYDENREFIEYSRTDNNAITVIGYGENPRWHVLLNEEFASIADAERASSFYGGQIVQLEGAYRVFFEEYLEWQDAFDACGRYGLDARPYTDASPALRVISGQDSALLFQLEGSEAELAILPLADDGEPVSTFLGEQYYGGFACAVFENDRLCVINCIGLEDYVKGVVPYEMNPLWPYEALRAQAVCARTYVVYNQNAFEQYGFDLTNDTESQVYCGLREANSVTDAAVDSTAGQLIRYRGEVCEIYYFAADGGSTENGRNVFDTDRPYLAGKKDPFELAMDYPLRSWEVRYDGTALSSLLVRRAYDLGAVVSILPEYSETENVIALTFTDELGRSIRIDGRPCYTSIRLNSCHFTISKDGDTFVFSGGGLGHSCGMSQWGAYAMAVLYGYDYRDILQFYYTGAYVA